MQIVTQSLIDQLIIRYEIGVSEIKKMDNMVEITHLLSILCIDFGICACSLRLFGIEIKDDEWVLNGNTKGGTYWYGTPITAKTKNGVLRRLKYRINRMKSYTGSIKMEISQRKYIDTDFYEWSDITIMLGSPLTKLHRLRYEIVQKTHITKALPPCAGDIFLTKNAFDDLNRVAKNINKNITDILFDVVMIYKPKGNPLKMNSLLGVSIKSSSEWEGDIQRLYFEISEVGENKKEFDDILLFSK